MLEVLFTTLNSCFWCREFIWMEDFTIRITDEDEMSVDLVEEPFQSSTRDGGVQAKYVHRLR